MVRWEERTEVPPIVEAKLKIPDALPLGDSLLLYAQEELEYTVREKPRQLA